MGCGCSGGSGGGRVRDSAHLAAQLAASGAPVVLARHTERVGYNGAAIPDVANGGFQMAIPEGTSFLTIGPASEWDAAVAVGTPAGDVPFSVRQPLIMQLPRGCKVRPFYNGSSIGESQQGSRAILDIVAYDRVPTQWGFERPPRQYFFGGSHGSGVTSTESVMSTVCIAGAKSVSLYLENLDEATSISWRVLGTLCDDDTVEQYPVSPNGYPDATPTYEVLTGETHDARHLDVFVDSFQFLTLYVKTLGANSALRGNWLVRD